MNSENLSQVCKIWIEIETSSEWLILINTNSLLLVPGLINLEGGCRMYAILSLLSDEIVFL